MQNMSRITRCFLMLTTVYCGAICATPSSNQSKEQASIDYTDKYMATFLKRLNDDEKDKVLYKNGKIAFFANLSKLTTALFGLGGLALIGANSYLALKGKKQLEPLLNAAVMLIGAGCSAFGAYRLIKHFTTESFIVLDDDGLIEWKIRKFSWSKIAKIEIKNVQVYEDRGNVAVLTTMRVLHFMDWRGKTLYLLSENEESLPIDFYSFISVVEHYWNKAINGQSVGA